MKSGRSVAPAVSAPVLGFFRRIVRRYFRRHFHAVRLSEAHQAAHASAPGHPLIVYANHSSWWDPMVSVFLADRLMRERLHFAPMDADALRRYAILGKVGVFPVEMETARGAAQFMRTGRAVLEQGGILWVTPQGRFVDVRTAPLEFKPGLARLASRVADAAGDCTLLPLAIEYAFWDERLPEVLLRFGTPVRVLPGETADRVQARLLESLATTMGELRDLATTRDPASFTTLLHGSRGVGGFYALGKRVKAIVLRRPYQPEHTVTESAPEE